MVRSCSDIRFVKTVSSGGGGGSTKYYKNGGGATGNKLYSSSFDDCTIDKSEYDIKYKNGYNTSIKFMLYFQWTPKTVFHLLPMKESEAILQYRITKYWCNGVSDLRCMFMNDNHILEIMLPEQYGYIHNVKNMFYNCPLLECVIIPESWGTISDPTGIFTLCPNLKIENVIYPKAWEKYKDVLISNQKTIIRTERFTNVKSDSFTKDQPNTNKIKLPLMERWLEKLLHLIRVMCVVTYVCRNLSEFIVDKNKLKNIFKDIK